MKSVYFISEADVNERRDVYNFIHDNYDVEDYFRSENMIKSGNVFMLDLDDNILRTFDNITCLSEISKSNLIMNSDDFIMTLKK